jgi:hypothetical protein
VSRALRTFVGDAGAANVSAAAAAAAESTACGEEGGSVTYIIPLTPTVMPTADQARRSARAWPLPPLSCPC